MSARTSHPEPIHLRAFEAADHAAAWSLWQRTPGVGLIRHLVVDAAQRRRGIARALLDAARAALAAQGIDKAHLPVFRSNEEGLTFWNRVAVARSELALYSVNTRRAP